MSLWVIWLDRNNIVFDNYRPPMPVLFNSIPSMLETGKSLKPRKTLAQDSVQTWTAPPPMCWKINSDAAVSTDKQLSILSAVCRNSEGEIIRSGVSVLDGCVNAEVAEIKAVIFGLSLVSNLQDMKVICEMDALNIANRLQNPGRAEDYLQVLTEDCMAACLDRDVSFQFVKRSCNQVAHALAKWGMFFGRDCVFDGNVPFPVNEIVTIDIH
ncbi:uncharacterized protein LOC126668101 [Mercurialis annua]|uniref:uncharacterized protein LOC126668101 n=1 Tax=Mercurialis annua TaxID=3986 RepID=UPI00215E78A6|nr:uncharacterized protein LOC126668101 [Mercurialis annua]